jgi:hypothetical protein
MYGDVAWCSRDESCPASAVFVCLCVCMEIWRGNPAKKVVVIVCICMYVFFFEFVFVCVYMCFCTCLFVCMYARMQCT